MRKRNFPGWFVAAACVLLLLGAGLPLRAQESLQTQEQVRINASAPTTTFPHFWEEMFGSGRGNLAMRASYRSDMRAVKAVTDFDYVRFHGILDDDNGVYTEDAHGNPVYNWSYVDQIYDGLLAEGVKPFVELSFMPKQLAMDPYERQVFWYHPIASPPKSWSKWDDFIQAFARHLVDRYGINEVSQWYFEVWNEPNEDFWDGVPRQQSYFQLYAHTARDLKSVSPRLRVGGPATAHAAWIPAFLKFTEENHVPVDFVSTHGYADDTNYNLFVSNGDTSEGNVPEDERVCRAIAMVRRQIDASATPHLPLFWTEWNVQGLDQSRDTIFVGPALANTVRQCDGHVNMMSFWTFSDVFEEGGVIPKPFQGHFGLRAKGGINKPSFYAFALLHELGDRRIANPSKDVIVTKTKDGGLVIAAWNLVDPGRHGTTKTMEIDFSGLPARARATLQRVDSNHSNTLTYYKAMGSPVDPTPAQVRQLNRESALAPPENLSISNGKLTLTLTPNALDLIKIQP